MALWAQARLPEHALEGGLCFAAAAALFVLSLVGTGSREEPYPAGSDRPSRPWRRPALILAASVPPCIAALVLFHFDMLPNLVISLWLVSIATALYGAWRLDRSEPPQRPASAWTKLEIAVLLAIVLLALFLRVWRIWDFPGVYEDEGVHIRDAYRVQDGEITTPFVSATWSVGAIFHYGLAGLLTLGIDPIMSLKLMGIIPGTLTCAFLYLFLRECFDSVIAAIAAALLATSSYHILTSRWGYSMALDGLLVVIALYFIARSLRTRHRLDFAVAGAAIGCGLLLTKSAATAPLLVAAIAGFLLWRYRRRALGMFNQQFVLMILLAVLVFAPRALYIVEQPSVALARPREVFLFSQTAWADLKEDPLKQTVENARDLLLTFNYRSGYEGRWNARPLKPTLDVISGALLVLGFAYAVFRLRERRYFLLLATAIAILVPASTALALDDRPVTYRLMGAVPVVYGFAAIPLWLLWRAQRAALGKGIVALAALLLVGVSAYLNYDVYFGQYGTSAHVYHVTGQVETRVAKHIISLGDRYHIYLTTWEVFNPTVELITRGRVSYDPIESVDDVEKTTSESPPLAFVVVKKNKRSDGTFAERLLPVLKEVYPEGREVEGERDPDGQLIYVTYFVDGPQTQ